MEITELKPKEVFYWFGELSKIPRESGNEKGVADFLENFAKERNFEVYRDENNNVIIKKEATQGYEDRPTIALQGHSDMVCVKDDDIDHDFEKDPIELVVDGNYLKANGTTLGADDGIAVAYGLAILDSKELKHPKLELVVTTEEETSMGGVSTIDTSEIKADYLLNIDSEEEGEFTVGCAGGVEVISEFDKEFEDASGEFVEIKISGLTGGHSGMEIDKYRKNGIKEMARMVYNLRDFRLSVFEGGSKKNAIATNAHAIVEVEDSQKAVEKLENLKKQILHEAKDTDPNAKITVEKVEKSGKVLTKELSKKIVGFVYTIPNGLYNKDLSLNTLTSSSNVGVLTDSEDKISVNSFVRSSLQSEKENYRDQIAAIAESFGAKVKFEHDYPGWEKEENPIIDFCKELYEKEIGRDAIVTTTHGGLECGYLKKQLPNTVMISFGPNLHDVHTSRENAEIDSIERIYKYLVKLLEEIK
ncbi:MAG: aminoacyl-histidine dipeptidase [Tissierellia bacterium]|nr:aminoacyl-histidine dipeptidase [Tissierellia bacterium]